MPLIIKENQLTKGLKKFPDNVGQIIEKMDVSHFRSCWETGSMKNPFLVMILLLMFIKVTVVDFTF